MKNKKIKILGITYLSLFILWSITQIFIYPNLHIDNIYILQLTKDFGFKVLIWLIPAILLINKYNDYLYIKKDELYNSKINYKYLLKILGILLIIVFLNSLIRKGTISINNSFNLTNIIMAISAGITEEFVLRGFLLNIIYNENKHYQNIIINALLFLLIHFPFWIVSGVLISNITSLAFLSIIVLSIVLSEFLIENKNIKFPIIVHIFWDLIIFMFI